MNLSQFNRQLLPGREDVCARCLESCAVRARAGIASESCPRRKWLRVSLTGGLPAGEAGTELKKILARLRITSGGGCACDPRAAEMDARGIEWCEANIELICDWLREAARQRGLPFVRAGAKILVRLAIRRARKI